MEKEHEDRYIDWPTVLEYFTKRGRPLSEEELETRKQEDYEEEDQYEKDQEEKKAEEEQFFKDLRQGSEHLSPRKETNEDIEDGRDDIEDMPVASSGRPDFTSTDKSKKKVTFDSTLNDRTSTFTKSRPQSANLDKSMPNDTVTGRDYVEHRRSKKRKGKSTERKITVPKPFKFDTREKIRPKSIRERKVDEMIEEKRIEEDKLLAYKFRAKQPAKEIITPLFKKINDKNEKRRQEVKANSMKITKEKENPFSFYERDVANKEAKKNRDPYMNEEFQKGNFKANDVPRSSQVPLYWKKLEREQAEREIRVKRAAEENFKKSKLPPRMEMHERMKKEKELFEKEEKDPKESLKRFGTFEPPRAKPIPDFDRLQRNFQETLDRKKSSQKKTEPKPFKFDAESKNKKKGGKTKASLRTFMDEENNSKSFNRSAKKKAGYIPNYAKPVINPKTTMNQTVLEKRRREELGAKMKKEFDTIEENRKRHENQNKIKGLVQNMYAALDNTKEKEKEKDKNLFQKVMGMKKEAKKNEQKIKEDIEAGRNRPLLIERYEADKEARQRELDGLNAIRMVRDTMVKNGLDPNKHLSDEQKDKLADADFLDKHGKNRRF